MTVRVVVDGVMVIGAIYCIVALIRLYLDLVGVML